MYEAWFSLKMINREDKYYCERIWREKLGCLPILVLVGGRNVLVYIKPLDLCVKQEAFCSSLGSHLD